jgi:hypothetical protein
VSSQRVSRFLSLNKWNSRQSTLAEDAGDGVIARKITIR